MNTARLAPADKKMLQWMSNGAWLTWLIDPICKRAIDYRAGQMPEAEPRPDFLDGEGPLEGFRLKMERFWP